MVNRNLIAGILCLSIVFLRNEATYAQRLFVGIDAGYSTFSMRELKDLQKEMKSRLPVDGKIVETFPGYLNYSANFMRLGEESFVRVFAGHTSTAGRISYSDYSGSIAIDQLASMTYTGGQAGFGILTIDKFKLFAGVQLLSYFNKLKIVSQQSINDQNNMSVEKFYSFNLALGPLLESQKQFNRFLVKIQAGYEFHLPGKLHYNKDSDYYLTNSSNDSVHLNGDGIRISGGISYQIN